MTFAQIFCTAHELVTDLGLNGDEPRLLQRIREASQFINRRFGRFIPVVETRILEGVSTETLDLAGPLVAVTQVRVDSAVVTDYTLHPRARCWENGPYTWLERKSGWGTVVEITGSWGLYNERSALGITASQGAGDVTLVAANGSLISPGMVLQINNEQQLVTAGNGGERSPAATTATARVNGAVDNTVEEIIVTNGSEFNAGEVLQIGSEDLFIRRIAGNTLVCARGWNRTNKLAHAHNAVIGVYRTYSVLRGVNGTTASAHSNAALQRCLPPADVHWLTLQIAGLMRQKVLTAFGGRAGNPEVGETFYVNEFPRQITQIQDNYAIPYL